MSQLTMMDIDQMYMDESKMDQNLFDCLMLLTLETISSEDYLSYYKIYREKPIKEKDWKNFAQRVANQDRTLQPGIYPEAFNMGAVHYHAIKKVGREKIIGNGYPQESEDYKNFGNYYVGLNAQEDHSHGFCQIYALMFYHGDENLLYPGEYRKNIDIGLEWAQKFAKKHEWSWTKKDLYDHCDIIINDSDTITLTRIINILRDPNNRFFLNAWFQED